MTLATFADRGPLRPFAPARALDYFRGLVPLPGIRDPGRWADDQHRVAFTLALDTEGQVLERVQSALARMLETGEVAEGPQLIDKLLDLAGIGKRNSGYADLVLRTNLMDAYQQGDHEEAQEVADEFNVWAYRGIRDGRERPSHEVHFDKYFSVDVPFTQVRDSVKGSYDGYQCRCFPHRIHRSEWKRLQEQGARVEKFSEGDYQRILRLRHFAEPPPDRRQDNAHHCGPAALQAALEALTGQRIAEAELAAELGTTPEDGTPPEAMAAVADRHGLAARPQFFATIADLKRHTDTGGLVLCPVQMHGTPAAETAGQSGHWTVVFDVDGDGDGDVCFHDPARTGGGERSLPAAEWRRRWVDVDGRGRWYSRYGVFLSRGSGP